MRLWRLDYHSIWFDEAISLRWARSAPEYTWDVTLQLVEEKHPPIYYLLLHFWTTLIEPFGLMRNDVALRVLGSLLGVLTVLGILLLARRLERSAHCTAGRSTGGNRACARLVQPGTPHVPAGHDCPHLGGILPHGRLAQPTPLTTLAVVDGHDRVLRGGPL